MTVFMLPAYIVRTSDNTGVAQSGGVILEPAEMRPRTGALAIPPYRVQLQDDALNVFQAEIVDCPEDESAVAKALAMLVDAPIYATGVEVWQQDRCVFKLRSVSRCAAVDRALQEERPSGQPRCRVLVCDDHRDLLDIMRRICLGLDYAVRTVDRGWLFMAAYVQSPPDCIVLDLNLPDIGGISLLRWLLDVGCTARIIVTSGTSDESQLARVAALAQRGLSIEILRKPFELSELVQMLHASERVGTVGRNQQDKAGR